MPNIVLAKDQEKYWISYIKGRIKRNKNFLGFISGQTGSGKSWSSLRIAEELDPEFKIDRVVFSGLELMNLINKEGELNKGSVIVFEEVGVELSNRNWASVTNKMLNYLMQTFRHRCFILIMNSPFMDFVDASTRKLFHAELTTIGIDFNKKQTKLKPQLIQYNSRLQKFYYKRLKVITTEGILPVNIWRVNKPSDKLLADYEQKKRDYTDALNKKIMTELQKLETKDNKKNELTEVQQDTLNMLKDGKTIKQIAEVRKRAPRVVNETVLQLKKKGYTITRIYNELGRVKSYLVEHADMKDKPDISRDKARV